RLSPRATARPPGARLCEVAAGRALHGAGAGGGRLEPAPRPRRDHRRSPPHSVGREAGVRLYRSPREPGDRDTARRHLRARPPPARADPPRGPARERARGRLAQLPGAVTAHPSPVAADRSGPRSPSPRPRVSTTQPTL